MGRGAGRGSALRMPAASFPWGQPWSGAGKARGWGSSALTASSGKSRALSPLRPREFQARADTCSGGPLVRSVVAPAGLQLSGPILTATGITEWAPVQVPPQMTSLHSLTRVPPCQAGGRCRISLPFVLTHVCARVGGQHVRERDSSDASSLTTFFRAVSKGEGDCAVSSEAAPQGNFAPPLAESFKAQVHRDRHLTRKDEKTPEQKSWRPLTLALER